MNMAGKVKRSDAVKSVAMYDDCVNEPAVSTWVVKSTGRQCADGVFVFY